MIDIAWRVARFQTLEYEAQVAKIVLLLGEIQTKDQTGFFASMLTMLDQRQGRVDDAILVYLYSVILTLCDTQSWEAKELKGLKEMVG